MVLRRLPSVRRPSLGYGPTRSLSPLGFFGPFLGALLSALSSFFAFWSPLGSPFRSVATSSGLLFSAGIMFLPSLPGWSVGYSRGSVVWGALPQVVLAVCLRFVSVWLPSVLPLLLLQCLAAWWLFFPLGKLHYVRLGLLIRRWFPWGLCALLSVSSLAHTSCVMVLFYSSGFV